MDRKALKYYLLGGIVLVVVVVIVVILLGNSKSAGNKTQTVNTVNAPTSSTPATSVKNSTSTPSNSLIGTWVSAVQGKGLQGSGKITLGGTTTQIDATSDVDLVVQKVENNTGTGTITFNKFCTTSTISVPGKPDVTEPTQCLNLNSEPAVMQITGNTINYTGKSILGANIALSGTYTNNSMSGTFTRTSSSGKIDGTFHLVRVKN